MAVEPDAETLAGKLVEKSLDAFIMALETINRLSVRYRLEAFCFLICNSWELLLKARIASQAGDVKAIYYDGYRTHDLRMCLRKLFSDKDPVRRNVELVARLRGEATHLVISDVPREVMGMFQACVLNYHKLAREWFNVDLSTRVSVGMMTIVYDFDPAGSDAAAVVLKGALGHAEAEFLSRFCADLHNEFEELGKPSELMIDIAYRLVLTKSPRGADIALTKGPGGDITQIVEVPKDPCITHPYRQKEAIEEINHILSERGCSPGRDVSRYTQQYYKYPKIIHEGDIQRVSRACGARKRPEFFYQGSVPGSPGQYSQAFVDWILREIYSHPDHFTIKWPEAGEELR